MRRVLFVCWGNCVRSQMAEALLRYRGAGRFKAYSAGAAPVGAVHPFASAALREIHVSDKGLRSKSWTEFKDHPLDAVITLCNAAREEVCPQWPLPAKGEILPVYAHWSIEDPLSVSVMGEQNLFEEFRKTRDEIRDCIESLVIAPNNVLNDDSAFAHLLKQVTHDPVSD